MATATPDGKTTHQHDLTARVNQLQEELSRPEHSLAAALRSATILAALLGTWEYRALFEMHLSGISRSDVNSSAGGRPSPRPDGYHPPFHPGEAFLYDRSRTDGNIQSLPLEELESMHQQCISIGKEATSAEALKMALETVRELGRPLTRIRNRVNRFAADAHVQIQNLNSKGDRLTSELTGLPSLAEFSSDLSTALSRSTEKCVIAFIDLDNLKRLNNDLGHDRADRVIAGVARILERSTLGRGTVYHRSGDEFLVILKNHTAAEAGLLLGRVCRNVAEADYDVGLPPGEVTVSIGAAEHGVHAQGAEDLREAAIRANQTAKRLGKNRVFIPNQDERAAES